MKLYYSPGACSLASHIVLHEVGAAFDIERVDTAAKVTQSGANYLDINSKGAVPVLDLGKGEILTEGAAILQHIADSHGRQDLAPEAATLARARVMEALNFVASELHKAFGPLFDSASNGEEKNAARRNVGRKFDWLEQKLSDGRLYLTGNDFTVADAYAFVVSNWANSTGIPLDRWPRLQAFVGCVAARPSVARAMQAESLRQA
jgi:glutathione S-transferase